MVSDFAPPFLSPVVYGMDELHRLLINFQVQAFTVPQPLRWRLATMPSADFYLTIPRITPNDAISVSSVRSPEAMNSQKPRRFLARASLAFHRSPVRQIPNRETARDRNMNFHRTAVGMPHQSFTVAVRSPGLRNAAPDVLCQLAFSLRLI